MLISGTATAKQYFKASDNAPKTSVKEKIKEKISDTASANKASAASNIIAQAKSENLKLALEVMKKIQENKTLFDIMREQRRKPIIDEEESEKRRARQKRINDLCAQIAHHRRRALQNPSNSRSDDAMVSSLTSQLVSVMFRD